MEELVEPRIVARIRRESDDLAARLAKRGIEAESVTVELAALESKIRSEATITATATRPEFSTKYTGTIGDILSQVDLETIDSFKLTWEKQYAFSPGLEVRFSKSDGCILSVEADDPEWVRAVFTSLVEEIEPGIPWWHRVRTDEGGLALSIVLAVVVAVIGLTVNVYVGLFAMMGAILICMPIVYVWPKVLPGFQLLAPGVPDRGRRAAGLLGVLVLGIVSSIIATLIMKD